MKKFLALMLSTAMIAAMMTGCGGSAATTAALVIVGLMMLSPIKEIELDDFSESVPAFLTIILMPLCYSISDGILIGMIAYVLINALCGKFKKISVTMWILAILFIARYLFL